MSRYVVIGTSPVVDTAVAVGPLTLKKTATATLELESRGYVTETCELLTLAELDEVEESEPWDGEGSTAP